MAPQVRLHMEALPLPLPDMLASLTPIRCISAFFLPDLGKDTARAQHFCGTEKDTDFALVHVLNHCSARLFDTFNCYAILF